MKLPPRWVTIVGLVLAVVSTLLDPQTLPVLTTIFGAAATTMLAAVGALLAAFGRALIPPPPTETP